MRTTIDLPEELVALARAVARDTGQTLGMVVAEYMRRGLVADVPQPRGGRLVGSRHGIAQVQLDRPVTSEDVRALDDE